MQSRIGNLWFCAACVCRIVHDSVKVCHRVERWTAITWVFRVVQSSAQRLGIYGNFLVSKAVVFRVTNFEIWFFSPAFWPVLLAFLWVNWFVCITALVVIRHLRKFGSLFGQKCFLWVWACKRPNSEMWSGQVNYLVCVFCTCQSPLSVFGLTAFGRR